MEPIDLVLILTCMVIALSVIFALKLKSLEEEINQLSKQVNTPKKKDT